MIKLVKNSLHLCIFSLANVSYFFPLHIEKLIAYQREFHALKERLRVAEHRTLQRSSELNNILEQFRRAIAETNSSKDALTNFSGNRYVQTEVTVFTHQHPAVLSVICVQQM